MPCAHVRWLCRRRRRRRLLLPRRHELVQRAAELLARFELRMRLAAAVLADGVRVVRNRTQHPTTTLWGQPVAPAELSWHYSKSIVHAKCVVGC